MLTRRALLAIAIVVEIAMLARGRPVAARALSVRQGRSPRHLEALLQDLVRHGLLKGTRGPRGGYELARERRRISLGDIVRGVALEAPSPSQPALLLVEDVIAPVLAHADASYLASLDRITVEQLTRAAQALPATHAAAKPGEFHI